MPQVTPESRCWVDARVSCPYGSPEGQFILRPTRFCHHNVCRHFTDEAAEIRTELDLRVSLSGTLRDTFNELFTDISTHLRVTADEETDPAIKSALERAAEALDRNELNADVMLREALEKID